MILPKEEVLHQASTWAASGRPRPRAASKRKLRQDRAPARAPLRRAPAGDPPAKAERGGELVLEAEGLGRLRRPARASRTGVDVCASAAASGSGSWGRTGRARRPCSDPRRAPGAPDGQGGSHRGLRSTCGYYDQETPPTCGTTGRRGHRDPARAPGGFTDLEVRSHLARFLFRGDTTSRPSPSARPCPAASGRACPGQARARPAQLAGPRRADQPPRPRRPHGPGGDARASSPAALVCISHDREFLDGLCDAILEVGPRRRQSRPSAATTRTTGTRQEQPSAAKHLAAGGRGQERREAAARSREGRGLASANGSEGSSRQAEGPRQGQAAPATPTSSRSSRSRSSEARGGARAGTRDLGQRGGVPGRQAELREVQFAR